MSSIGLGKSVRPHRQTPPVNQADEESIAIAATPASGGPVVPALFILKDDVETADDVRLAELEIEGLTGRRVVPFATAKAAGEWAPLLDAAAGEVEPERLLLGDIDPDDPSLSRRLGMIEEIRFPGCAGVLTIVPDQLGFERAGGARGTRGAMSPANRRKNEYLTHPFHKYKAKFFPRMARALTNYTTPGNATVLDPFVGSGTLTVEAALMGIPSAGIDVDPLSVFIAQVKVDALRVSLPEFDAAAAELEMRMTDRGGQASLLADDDARDYLLPEFIGRKLDGDRSEIELEVNVIRAGLDACPRSPALPLLRLALSHALATKVSLRWMGTGDNRFALAVARRTVSQIFANHVRRMRKALIQRNLLVEQGLLVVDELARADLHLGDVRQLPFCDETFAGVVTSPPYLPASSGRETYLRSRAPSLLALNLMTEQEILTREADEMIGSILRSANGHRTVIPREIVELVEWMRPQRARAPKAEATAVYFHDLADALREIGRVLKPGGRLAMVVSAQHVFYDLVTRNIVRRLSMPDVIAELIEAPANEIALRLQRVVTITLPKMDYAARPASREEYAEAIILAERA